MSTPSPPSRRERAANRAGSTEALDDFDLAFNLPDEHALLYGPRAIGNAMWRSPEAQTGEGLGKPSDVFSFGLVVLYASGAGDLLLIDNWRELKERGASPEQETLIKHFTYFGPATEGLLKRINDEDWGKFDNTKTNVTNYITTWSTSSAPMGRKKCCVCPHPALSTTWTRK